MKHIAPLSLLFSLAVSAGLARAATDVPTYQTKDYGVVHATGYVPSLQGKAFMKAARHKTFVGDTTPVPATFSLRGQAGPVEDQGSCGSCWDFSLTGVLRGTWMMAGKDPGRLSFNYLLNCATTSQGCDGGDFSAADFFVAPQGAPAYGADGTYTGTNGTCQSEPVVASTVSYTLLGQEANGTVSFQDIAYVVGVLHQPVSIDVAVNNTWEDYASGTFNGCNTKNYTGINHMVAIEGYNCETSVDSSGNCVFDTNGNLPKGVGTWLIRNSWGTTWGDAGYITTKATTTKGALCNSVGTDALYYQVTN